MAAQEVRVCCLQSECGSRSWPTTMLRKENSKWTARSAVAWASTRGGCNWLSRQCSHAARHLGNQRKWGRRRDKSGSALSLDDLRRSKASATKWTACAWAAAVASVARTTISGAAVATTIGGAATSLHAHEGQRSRSSEKQKLKATKSRHDGTIERGGWPGGSGGRQARRWARAIAAMSVAP